MIFIYENDQLSISILAKDEKTANKILKENVINPSQFVQEQGIDFDEEDIDV